MKILEISSPETLVAIKSKVQQNIPEVFTPSSTLNRRVLHLDDIPCFELWVLRLGLFTSTPGILNCCAWLLLFEVMRKILSLCLVSCWFCCTTLNVDGIIVIYICWKCLFVPEISSENKSSIIKRTLLLTLNYTNSEDSNNIYFKVSRCITILFSLLLFLSWMFKLLLIQFHSI